MRYPPEQKQRTREKLLAASAELSKKHGFSTMSVDDLMSAAGLTGGAFYAHFDSKSALFSELISNELARLTATLGPRDEHGLADNVTHLLNAYLTNTHVQEVAIGCVLPALGPEIARADVKVKRTFEHSINSLHEAWSERLGDSDLAWSTICQLVGTITIARAMASKAGAANVVSGSRAQLERTLLKRSSAAKSSRGNKIKSNI